MTKKEVTAMCVQRGLVSFIEARKNQKKEDKKQRQEIERLSTSAEQLYTTCLQTLESKFRDEGKELFYQTFENTYKQIYYKCKQNKKRYWSKSALVLFVLGTGGSGTVAAVSLFSIVRALFEASAQSGILAAITQIYAPLLIVFLLALGFLIACLSAEFERRNYKETWIRHSVAYHKLNIAMIRCLSNLVGMEDFMKEVLCIFEADIENFKHNTGNFPKASTQSSGTD